MQYRVQSVSSWLEGGIWGGDDLPAPVQPDLIDQFRSKRLSQPDRQRIGSERILAGE